MASDLEICNSALIKCGVEQIASLNDLNKRAKLCKSQYERSKLKLLREGNWNFAIKRVSLTGLLTPVPVFYFDQFFDLPSDFIKLINVTSSSTSDSFATAYSKGTIEHKIEGNRIATSNGGITNQRNFNVITGDTSNIQVTNHNAIIGDKFIIKASSTPALVNLERVVLSITDVNNFVVTPALPSAIQSNDVIALETPNTLFVEYIADVDEDLFDDSFVESLAYRIAIDLSYALLQDPQYKRVLQAEYQEYLRDTRSMDAQEGTPQELTDNSFINSRL